MRTLDLFVLSILAQVTFITSGALILIWFARKQSAFRHLTGLVGLVLVISSPVLVLVLPRPGWLTSEAQPSTPIASVRTEQIEPKNAVAPDSGLINHPIADGVPIGDPNVIAPSAAKVSHEDVMERETMTGVNSDTEVAAGKQLLVRRPEILAAAQNQTTKPVVRDRAIDLSILFNSLCVVWCLGVIYSGYREWRNRQEVKILSRSSIRWISDRSRRLTQEVSTTLGCKTFPPICISELTPLPFLLGILSPVVILPREMAQSASDERLRDILVHECAHVVRRDPWVHLLQRISAILFWLHPGVHWLNGQIGRAREELCDNFVLRTSDATKYAEMLLELAEACGNKRLGLSALGLFSPRWTLEQRIGGLLDPVRDLRTQAFRGTVMVLAILFGSLSYLIGGLGLVTSKASVEADEKPVAKANTNRATDTKQFRYERTAPATRKMSMHGKCVDENSTPIANVRVQVHVVRNNEMEGPISGLDVPPKSVIAEVKTDSEGKFSFSEIEVPKRSPFPEHQTYLFLSAVAEGRASASSQFGLPTLDSANRPVDVDEKEPIEFPALTLSSEPQSLSGIVTDQNGKPVAGAVVNSFAPYGANAIPGMWSSVTDREGRYSINDLERWKQKPPESFRDDDGNEGTIQEVKLKFLVQHPDYAISVIESDVVPNQVNVTLKPAAFVEGDVVDTVRGKPAAYVFVRAKGITHDGLFQTKSDENGHYRLKMEQDYFSIWVEAEDRIAAVLKEIKAMPGKPVTNAGLQLVRGGFVVGTVIDEETGKPLVGSVAQPTYVAHYGPACIKTQVLMWVHGEPPLSIGVQQSTRVNPDGTFRLRVAPGKNCVFFLQDYGEEEQSYQVVSIEDGQEQKVELRVKRRDTEQPNSVRERSPKSIDQEFEQEMERFAVLRFNANADEAELVRKHETKSIATTSEPVKSKAFRIPSRQRPESVVCRLLDKFENNSISGLQFREPWLRTIKEIVELGPAAVPDLIEELDATEDPWMLQLLGFVLRAINDRRAIPALIRAIPKALPEPEPRKFRLEDMLTHRHWPTTIMLQSDDPELFAFACSHELGPSRDPQRQTERKYCMYKSTIEELCGALTKMTGASNGEKELFNLVNDGRNTPEEMQAKQQQFDRIGKAWSNWWQQHQHDEFVTVEDSPEEAAAINSLEQAGCELFRDGSLPGRPVTRIQCQDHARFTLEVLTALKSLRSLRILFTPGNVVTTQDQLKEIGELHTLTDLHFGGRSKLSGPRLKALGGLIHLKNLGVIGFDLKNDDLKDIGQMTSLTELYISGMEISDDGLKHLQGLQNLSKIDLTWLKITNVGLKHLCELQNLTQVELKGSNITDAGLKELRSLSHLTHVDLSNTKITGIGFNELKDLQNLSSLKLENTRVGDAGLKEISELKSLRSLYLENTKITDDGINDLAKLKNLKYLYVPETEISHEGLLKLKQALPDTSVRERS